MLASVRSTPRSWVWGLVLAVWALAVPAFATTAVAVSLEDLVAQSDAVVHGTVASTSTVTVARGGRLVTVSRATLRVQSWLVGRGDATVIVETPGGAGRGVTVDALGAPHLRRGQEVVVFLRRDGGVHHVLGWTQGLFTIVRDPSGTKRAFRDLDGLELVDPARGLARVADPMGGPIALDALLTRVRAAGAGR